MKAKQQKTSSWLIVSIALAAIVLLVGGAIFAINSDSQGTLPAASLPAETPLLGPEEEPVLKDMVVKLDELPTGWYQAAFQEDMTGEYRIDGVRVVFRNKKYATLQEEISVANNVWLCGGKEAAVYLFERERKYYKEISLADRAVYDATASHLRIIFVKGLFLAELEYYGIPLENVNETEKFQFIYSLAKIVAQRIP